MEGRVEHSEERRSKPRTSRRFSGLIGPARAWLISKLRREHRQIVVVSKDRRSCEELIDDLTFFLPSDEVVSLPTWDTLPFEYVSPQAHIAAQRLYALSRLLSPAPAVVVLSIDTLLQRVLPAEVIAALQFELSTATPITHAELQNKLELCGFQRVSLVEDSGEMAVQGSIIDFFPASVERPIRAEFDEHHALKSLREFDEDSQRSLAELARVAVYPVREYPRIKHIPSLYPHLTEAIDRVKRRGKELETPPREIARATNSLRTGNHFPGAELLPAIALPELPTILQYLSPHGLLVVNDEIGMQQAADSYYEIIDEREKRLSSEHHLIPKKEWLYLAPNQLFQRINSFERCYLDHLQLLSDADDEPDPTKKKSRNLRSASTIELATKLKTKVGTGDAFQPLGDALTRWRQENYSVAFAVGSATRAERLHRILLDLNHDAHLLALNGSDWAHAPHRYPLVVLEGHLSSGVQLPEEGLVFIAEHEIFSERSYRKRGRSRTSVKKILGALAQLKEKDHVVHTDYGIGIYHGLKHLEVEGIEGDFLHIEYADSRLYLPVQNIGKIQKFVAAEGQRPILDKLGATRWIKTKEKVKEAVIPLAGDLIRLYAARSVAKGWRYEPYGAEDERFADNFPYEETPDQLKAIYDTITDMASARPMDRLVCGDVGFGKTEVALRAAYKCTQHARQVAILVPTTILVEQHKNNFAQRFNGYPVRVAAVSRFYDAAHNRKVLDQLATGKIDVIVGTHRLLSKDVIFRDLGLVIIDEEHRFGVKQKEKLKALKTQVDVLTLTATPIPRTLHMSLLGIRDISVISTPPHDRRVIRTYIAGYDDSLVRDAILRELQRNGQCFYIHNRVQSIELLALKLRQLVPEARFEFAHAQMPESHLEKIMRRYLQHEIDVLISTTIVESGIDIPNANTILIERADTFGLAQLYQLRGRVGRSTRQAYAYFLLPKANKLHAEAQQRLKALQSLDDLGLGFNLALRDMEIRGAGNLLGKEQSGNVTAVGFDLYSRILKEAVLNLKGEEIELEELVDPEVKLPLAAYLPEFYIPDVAERLGLYQRLSAVRSSEETDELAKEMEDRFGNPGREVYNLIEVMRLRSLLRQYGVLKAELLPQKLQLSFSPRAPIDGTRVVRLMQHKPERYRFGKNLLLSIADSFDEVRDPHALYEYIERELAQIGGEGKTLR